MERQTLSAYELIYVKHPGKRLAESGHHVLLTLISDASSGTDLGKRGPWGSRRVGVGEVCVPRPHWLSSVLLFCLVIKLYMLWRYIDLPRIAGLSF